MYFLVDNVGCVVFNYFFSFARRGLEFQENFHFASPGDVDVCVPKMLSSIRIISLASQAQTVANLKACLNKTKQTPS